MVLGRHAHVFGFLFLPFVIRVEVAFGSSIIVDGSHGRDAIKDKSRVAWWITAGQLPASRSSGRRSLQSGLELFGSCQHFRQEGSA